MVFQTDKKLLAEWLETLDYPKIYWLPGLIIAKQKAKSD
jgi:hypothetical protein